MPTEENFLTNLPDDKEALKAMLRSLWQERERQEKRAEEYLRKAEEQRKRADDLYLEKLRLQQELERYKKATYGPRADRLSMNQLAQMLLEFAERLEQKPIRLEDLRQAEPEPELRRVKRRKGRRALANFENLPVNTYVYELSAEEGPARVAVWSARRSAARRAGRSNTFRDTSNALSMSARSMRAPVVNEPAKTRRSK